MRFFVKVVGQNKKAFFDYYILDTVDAGIVLTGDEVKSLRGNKVSMVGSFAVVTQGELYLLNCHIPQYDKAFAGGDKEAATRRRKFLLHRRELDRLIGDVSRKGITLIPLKIYFNDRNVAKVQIGICKHKKAAGKKQVLKERDIKRETSRELKSVYKA